MDSSMRVPPRSLTPQRSASVAVFEAHFDPGGLEVGDRFAEGEAEDGGVLEVLLAADLFDAVGAAEEGLEGDGTTRGRTR